MSKITFKRFNLPKMTLESAKETISTSVKQLETVQNTFGYRITFTGLNQPGYIYKVQGKVVFSHFCEHASKGSSCSHMKYAAAAMDMIGTPIEYVGFPKSPSLPAELKDVSFEDCSIEINVVPPLPTTSMSSPSSTPIPAASVVPSISKVAAPQKRDWTLGWNDVKDHLTEQGVSARIIMQIQDKRKEICETVFLTPMAVEPTKPTTPYMGEMLGRALRHILLGKDLLLVGDKGSGKDTLVATLCWIFGLPLYLQPGNSDETKESVIGENTVVQGDKGMEIRFNESAFTTAVVSGGISHYAELNMMHGNVTSIFHSVLDENRQLASQVGSFQRHQYHIFIGSINVGEQYVGVRKLNSALKDRLSILKLPYVQDFRTMLIKKSGLTDPYALDFLESVKDSIDKLVAEESQGEESKTIRGYIDAARHLQAYGVTFDSKVEVLEDFIINKTEEFEEQMAIRDMIRQKVWADFPMSVEEEQYVNGGI
ncbi:hypothetical protein AM501_24015 [Aneurinibacillus migulanus]|uniref:AAA family ATPase n=1 Tax=Aneurinibacillus migulanus TaxID=47500 RepID=UPI0005BADFC9|nr:AAA family ATPase [Aneurinibacillus migulanus]KIV58925.1 hypothetical protein TS64_03965 [Aneurinibacillus migulanus]KPD05843.1 hypothetical protein AM501_24015 [Aneurinibacillus migulanus]